MALPSTATGRALLGARTALGISTLLAPRLAGELAPRLDRDDVGAGQGVGRQHQVDRVARARGLPSQRVDDLVTAHTSGRVLGFLGEPTVNVTELNAAVARAVP